MTLACNNFPLLTPQGREKGKADKIKHCRTKQTTLPLPSVTDISSGKLQAFQKDLPKILTHSRSLLSGSTATLGVPGHFVTAMLPVWTLLQKGVGVSQPTYMSQEPVSDYV